MFDFGGMFGGGAGMGAGGELGGGDMLGRITQLAQNWNPFPMLQQLNAGTPGVAAPQQGIAPGEWDWMNPMGAGGPIDPTKVQSGPLAGVSTLPTPPAAAKGPTPLSTQQMAMLGGMMPKPQEQPRFAPAVSPPGAGRAIQMSPIPGIAPVAPRIGLAEILGRR